MEIFSKVSQVKLNLIHQRDKTKAETIIEKRIRSKRIMDGWNKVKKKTVTHIHALKNIVITF